MAEDGRMDFFCKTDWREQELAGLARNHHSSAGREPVMSAVGHQ
jgi:hypothetical protein